MVDTACYQSIANPHVVKADNGDWLISAYGVWKPPFPQVCDAIGIIRRHASDGAFTIPTASALSFQPVTPQCVNYLGAAAGIAKSSVATSGGYKYFMLIQVTDSLNEQGCALSGNSATWFTWAVSMDGLSWLFLHQDTIGLTGNPLESKKMLRRADCHQRIGGVGQVHFKHYAVVYHAGYLFMYITYSRTQGGLAPVFFRTAFSQSSVFGVTSGLQRWSWSSSQWVAANSYLSDTELDDSFSSVGGLVDVNDATILTAAAESRVPFSLPTLYPGVGLQSLSRETGWGLTTLPVSRVPGQSISASSLLPIANAVQAEVTFCQQPKTVSTQLADRAS